MWAEGVAWLFPQILGELFVLKSPGSLKTLTFLVWGHTWCEDVERQSCGAHHPFHPSGMATVPSPNFISINYQPGEQWDCQKTVGSAHSARNCSEMRRGLINGLRGREAPAPCASSREKGWRSLSQTQRGEIHQIREEQALYPHEGCVRPPELQRTCFCWNSDVSIRDNPVVCLSLGCRT